MALIGKVISICVWSGDAGHVLVIVVILAFSSDGTTFKFPFQTAMINNK